MTSLFPAHKMYWLLELPKQGLKEQLFKKEREKEDGFWSRNHASCMDYIWTILLWCLTNFLLSVPEISPEILRIHLSCQLFVCLFYLDTTLPMAASRWDLKSSCQQSSSGLLPFLISLNHELWILNHEKAHIFFQDNTYQISKTDSRFQQKNAHQDMCSFLGRKRKFWTSGRARY